MADEERYIYFIEDQPHLIKTALLSNCLPNYLSWRCIRSMWNDEKFLTSKHIYKLFINDLDCGLHLVPKITNDHIRLTPFSVMNVKVRANECYKVTCYMLQSRIRFATVFHATCYKFPCSMLHATRMNMFILVACYNGTEILIERISER